MNKILKRLGLKDQYGWEETSVVGFIVLWSAFGYGAFIVVTEIWNKFS